MPGETANLTRNSRLENFFLDGEYYWNFRFVNPKLHRGFDDYVYESRQDDLLTQTIDGLTPVVALSYELSALGQVEQLSASIGGVADFVNTYDYDDLGRLNWGKQTDVIGGNAVADKRVDFTYDAASRYSTITRYADLNATDEVATGTYTFDPLGRLTDLDYTQPNSTGLPTYGFAYDAAGNMTWMETIDGEVDYTLDDTNQLTDADYVGDWQTDEDYDYDLNGNRTNGGYVTGDNNQLLFDGTYTYIYDAEGNRIYRLIDGGDPSTEVPNDGDTEITKYTWDNRNRLTEVADFEDYDDWDAGTSDQIVSYIYDCFNQLISRTLDPDGTSGATAVEQSIYINEGGQIIAQFDKTGTGDLAATDMTHRYLWNPQAVDQLLADEQIHYDSWFVTDDLLFALTDHQNTVRDLVEYDSGTDETSVELHRVFDAYGNESSSTGTEDTIFGYTGKLYDEATVLQNNWQRWYDATVARWVSEDSVWDGTNLYAYVGNNPMVNTDPSGLISPNQPNGPEISSTPTNPNWFWSDYLHYFRQGPLGFIVTGPEAIAEQAEEEYNDIKEGNYGDAIKSHIGFAMGAATGSATSAADPGRTKVFEAIGEAADPEAAERGRTAAPIIDTVVGAGIGAAERGLKPKTPSTKGAKTPKSKGTNAAEAPKPEAGKSAKAPKPEGTNAAETPKPEAGKGSKAAGELDDAAKPKKCPDAENATKPAKPKAQETPKKPKAEKPADPKPDTPKSGKPTTPVKTPRQAASERGAELVKKYKKEGLGQRAGRSGGHGTPYKRAGAELKREANKLPKNDPLREAMKKEGDRLIEKGKGYDHRGGGRGS